MHYFTSMPSIYLEENLTILSGLFSEVMTHLISVSKILSQKICRATAPGMAIAVYYCAAIR